jgi:putative acetyltransferase
MTKPEINIRPFVITDYDDAVRVWNSVGGVTLNESDTVDAIDQFLDRNPNFSAVAEDHQGCIIGTILCGHNGRAGSIQHLAVLPEHQSQGIAKRLLAYSLNQLSQAKIPRCNIFVYNDNAQGNAFWEKNGWIDPSTWRVLQKHVDEV